MDLEPIAFAGDAFAVISAIIAVSTVVISITAAIVDVAAAFITMRPTTPTVFSARRMIVISSGHRQSPCKI
jgi:hypothetical protein